MAAPELQIGFFGGDPDNFTYPRYNLDFSFFRIYGDDGQPLDSRPYFQVGHRGRADGEPIFIIGNPGSTSRLQSVAELEFRRDVSDRYLLDFLRDRVAVLQQYADAHPQEAERLDLANTIFELQNSEKAYEGQLKRPRGCQRAGPAAQAAAGVPRLHPGASRSCARKYRGMFAELAQLQRQKRAVRARLRRVRGTHGRGFSSATLHRALCWPSSSLSGRSRGAPEDALQPLREQLLAGARAAAGLDQG